MKMTITAPITHEKIAAGPATCAAYSGASSQPEPMMQPMLVNSSPTLPSLRCSADAIGVDTVLSFCPDVVWVTQSSVVAPCQCRTTVVYKGLTRVDWMTQL